MWPPPGIPHLKIDIATILTVILVTSSVVIQLSLRSIRSGDQRRARPLPRASRSPSGVAFLLLQLYDYSQLGFGVKDGTFGTLFYVMTGIHMAHVFGGVVFLALVFGQAMGGALSPLEPRLPRGRRHLLGLRRRRVAAACSRPSTC